MFYFYVIENYLGELYFGSTNDLKRRFIEHKTGKCFSTKGSDWKLIYYEAYRDESDASRREQRIKDHGQAVRHLKERLKNCRRSKD
ncbi:GIY-YIG nuclease family protein [Candidatus Kaiserbacteria bacterium]|nr:GIY-YIG nuclease family protein [Candidatus Kaiserbacteria bacterium]USN91788.1 MAG: GIY-YIG nuclease family protein [Candidatus Nomurabacteria bacterium]